MASITLSPALSERIEQAARQHGTDAEAYIEELLGPPFQETAEEEEEGVRRALEQSALRQGRTLEEWRVAQNTRHPRPEMRPGADR